MKSSLILFSFVDIHITYNAKNGVKEDYVPCTLSYMSISIFQHIDINNTIVRNISKSLHFLFVNLFTRFKLFFL